jgi:DNA polymerase I-like protein with 3'-5' exonuclease and polymerase domains
MNYGGGPPVIYEQLKLWFPNISLKAVEHMYDRWKNAHVPIFAFQRKMFENAKTNGFVVAPLSGRRLQFYLDRVVPTEAANFPIQASAGDVINPASLRLVASLDAGDSILMQIHDALYVETSDAARAAKTLREAMKTEVTFPNGKSMIFDIDIKVGTSWGDMKELKDGS